MLFDSHCHLDKLSDTHAAIARAKQAGVSRMVCISVDLDAWPAMMDIVSGEDGIYASVGVHPGYPDSREPATEQLVELSRRDDVVAIGETGLDYASRKTGDANDDGYAWQRERFRVHIDAAKLVNKPLIIHTRNAVEDTIRLLREEGANSINPNGNGIIHCFTESTESAKTFMELGFYISISGIVTFNSAKALQETVKTIPLDRLLIETDAPWLAPVPHRGKENEPSFVQHTAKFIAALKGIELAEVQQQTFANACRVFNLSE